MLFLSRSVWIQKDREALAVGCQGEDGATKRLERNNIYKLARTGKDIVIPLAVEGMTA